LKERGVWFPETSLGPIFKAEKDLTLYPSIYKAALSYIDHEIGRILEWLEKNKQIDKTLIIVTADHGENLLDNGVYCGHYKLFNETTWVPLIFKDPLAPHGKEVSSVIQHIDLMPTLLERLSLPIPSQVQGKSLWPAIWNDESVNSLAFSEHVHFYQKTLRTEEWQYIWANPDKTHPWGLMFEGGLLLHRRGGDNRNYASLHPNVCKEMEEMIHKLSEGFQLTEDNDEEMSQEMIDRLAALGYIDP
jgi:arylsulfatase A-like enzyme